MNLDFRSLFSKLNTIPKTNKEYLAVGRVLEAEVELAQKLVLLTAQKKDFLNKNSGTLLEILKHEDAMSMNQVAMLSSLNLLEQKLIQQIKELEQRVNQIPRVLPNEKINKRLKTQIEQDLIAIQSVIYRIDEISRVLGNILKTLGGGGRLKNFKNKKGQVKPGLAREFAIKKNAFKELQNKIEEQVKNANDLAQIQNKEELDLRLHQGFKLSQELLKNHTKEVQKELHELNFGFENMLESLNKLIQKVSEKSRTKPKAIDLKPFQKLNCKITYSNYPSYFESEKDKIKTLLQEYKNKSFRILLFDALALISEWIANNELAPDKKIKLQETQEKINARLDTYVTAYDSKTTEERLTDPIYQYINKLPTLPHKICGYKLRVITANNSETNSVRENEDEGKINENNTKQTKPHFQIHITRPQTVNVLTAYTNRKIINREMLKLDALHEFESEKEKSRETKQYEELIKKQAQQILKFYITPNEMYDLNEIRQSIQIINTAITKEIELYNKSKISNSEKTEEKFIFRYYDYIKPPITLLQLDYAKFKTREKQKITVGHYLSDTYLNTPQTLIQRDQSKLQSLSEIPQIKKESNNVFNQILQIIHDPANQTKRIALQESQKEINKKIKELISQYENGMFSIPFAKYLYQFNGDVYIREIQNIVKELPQFTYHETEIYVDSINELLNEPQYTENKKRILAFEKAYKGTSSMKKLRDLKELQENKFYEHLDQKEEIKLLRTIIAPLNNMLNQRAQEYNNTKDKTNLRNPRLKLFQNYLYELEKLKIDNYYFTNAKTRNRKTSEQIKSEKIKNKITKDEKTKEQIKIINFDFGKNPEIFNKSDSRKLVKWRDEVSKIMELSKNGIISQKSNSQLRLLRDAYIGTINWIPEINKKISEINLEIRKQTRKYLEKPEENKKFETYIANLKKINIYNQYLKILEIPKQKRKIRKQTRNVKKNVAGKKTIKKNTSEKSTAEKKIEEVNEQIKKSEIKTKLEKEREKLIEKLKKQKEKQQINRESTKSDNLKPQKRAELQLEQIKKIIKKIANKSKIQNSKLEPLFGPQKYLQISNELNNGKYVGLIGGLILPNILRIFIEQNYAKLKTIIVEHGTELNQANKTLINNLLIRYKKTFQKIINSQNPNSKKVLGELLATNTQEEKVNLLGSRLNKKDEYQEHMQLINIKYLIPHMLKLRALISDEKQILRGD